MFKKAILPIAVIIFLFSGFGNCKFYDVNKKNYNALSRQHNELANNALIKKDEAVDDYNDSKYQEGEAAANDAKALFQQALAISQKNKDNAAKIKDVPWLADYQSKIIKSEEYWTSIMGNVAQACEAQLKGDKNLANSLVQELESNASTYAKLQAEIDQIEKDHQDFFDFKE